MQTLEEFMDSDEGHSLNERYEEAFDLLKLDKHFDKEEFISERLEEEYIKRYSDYLDHSYHTMKDDRLLG